MRPRLVSRSSPRSLNDTDPQEGTETDGIRSRRGFHVGLNDTDPQEGTETREMNEMTTITLSVLTTPTRKRVLKHKLSLLDISPRNCLNDTDPQEGTETINPLAINEQKTMS